MLTGSCWTRRSRSTENDELQGRIARTSACIEGEFYGRLTRVEETIEFIRRMGFKKSRHRVLRRSDARDLRSSPASSRQSGIDYFTVGCKVGAVDKTEIGVPNEKKLNGGCGHESMCNPIMQAKTLAANGCDFNIVIGLCVGHDTLFLRHSQGSDHRHDRQGPRAPAQSGRRPVRRTVHVFALQESRICKDSERLSAST